jgi:hypothetical protein
VDIPGLGNPVSGTPEHVHPSSSDSHVLSNFCLLMFLTFDELVLALPVTEYRVRVCDKDRFDPVCQNALDRKTNAIR